MIMAMTLIRSRFSGYMKTCFCCKESKPLAEFYAHPRMADGHLNKCKNCAKKQADERRRHLEFSDPAWREAELKRHREKSTRTRRAGRASKATPRHRAKWFAQNPQRKIAHAAVSNAIRTGKLTRQPCHCGGRAEAHHEDYSKPLDVMWLCKKHHMERHVEINKERRSARFKALTTP